jgi:hypothetical protein
MEEVQENSKQHKLILVYYISVGSLRSADIPKYMEEIKKRIVPYTLEAEIIFVPIDGETRIECINPLYITDGDLIKKHERLMAELHEHLNRELKNG